MLIAIILIAAALVLLLALGYKRGWGSELGSGLEAANQAKKQNKDEQKTKVMALFATKNQITNDDVQKALGVSDATATRVLDSLQNDGLIDVQGSNKQTVYLKK